MSDTVTLRKSLQVEREAALDELVRRKLAPFAPDQRALDVGCGTGALSYALAPYVASVVGLDPSEAYIAAARDGAPANCEFIVGRAEALPFPYGAFDLAGCMRVLHHVHRPELVVAELARVTRPGGRILVVDQLGHVDPIRSMELDRFEHERDASHTRLLPDGDIRGLLDANDLVVESNETVRELREVERFLDLAGLEGEDRERIRRLAPAPVYEIEIGWYVALKR